MNDIVFFKKIYSDYDFAFHGSYIIYIVRMFTKKPAELPKVQKGKIDLSSWNFTKDPSVTLKEE